MGKGEQGTLEESRVELLQTQRGQVLQLHYLVGAGGGHKINLKKLTATIQYVEKEMSKIETIKTQNIFDKTMSDAFLPFQPLRVRLKNRIERLVVSFRWKDQGKSIKLFR